MRQRYRPRLILLHPDVQSSDIARRVLSRFPDVPVRSAASAGPWIEEARRSRQPETRGKQFLYLTRHQGQFLKPCPGICDGVTCCDYQVMDLGSNCPLECTYCVLQSYLNNPLMVVYANLDELLQQLDAALKAQPERIFRIGTGELTDSLALDWMTGISTHLIPFFAARPRAFLELKTKTAEVANLRHQRPAGQTLVSWSLNTPAMIAREEYKTCSLDERLDAARRCASWGYRVGFHFDPLIHYPEWERDYRQTIARVFEVVPAHAITWISMGALRFPPGLQNTLRRRFPKSPLPLGEIVSGVDGKGRYFRPIRAEMYRRVAGWIREHRPDQTLYLCMESPPVWRQALAAAPDDDHLAAMLDRSLISIAESPAAALP